MDGDQTFGRGRCDLKVDEPVGNPKFGTVGDLQPKMSCVKTTTFNVKLENFETLACFHQTALVSFCESASEMPFDLSTAREIITLSFWQSPAELSPSTRPSPRSASGSRPLIRKHNVGQVACLKYPFVRQEKGRTDYSPHQIYESALPGDLGLDPVGERHRVLALMPPHRRKIPARTDARLRAMYK